MNFFSCVPKFPLIPKVSPSPNTKNSPFRLSVWDDKLLSAPTVATFLS